VLGLPTAMATMMVLPLLAATALSTGFGGIGLVLFPRAMAGLRRWAEWHRRRAAALLGRQVSPRHMVLGKGIRARWRQVLDDPETRRDVRWMFRHIVTGGARTSGRGSAHRTGRRADRPAEVAAACFVVAGSLTNLAKHSGAA
jgi:hypothetical protein